MTRISHSLSLALGGLVVAAAAQVLAAATGDAVVTVSVARPDLRPLPDVSVRVSGGADRQGITDQNGRVSFAELPPAGAIVIRPSRSGFRFEPTQATVADPANPHSPAFAAFPTATDVAVSITGDDAAPWVGGLVYGVITLRNLGAEAATDVAVGISSLPGLALEASQAMQGRLEYQAYQTLWRLAQLEPGASAEVRVRLRAQLPDAKVLTVAVVEEMDQMDNNPRDNSAELITRPRPATARLSLAMTIDPATAKAGETIPVRLTLRNEGPNEATQVNLRSYLPPGASLVTTAEGLSSSSVVVPRMGVGDQVQLSGAMRVRIPGTFTLIANVGYLEQQMPPGAGWPEARAQFAVQPAFSRISLLAFTDPPNARVGEDINVLYVARNDGPDAVTGLRLFTREDSRLGVASSVDPNHAPPPVPVPGPFVFGDVLPVGAYTYQHHRYSVKAAGDLTNYFTVEYQDQLIPGAEDHAEINLPIRTLPADIALSLDANPREITAKSGDAVTVALSVHNDGPQPAHGVLVDYESRGLFPADLDEVIHADRVVRPQVGGYIDVLQPNEAVTVLKHLVAWTPGTYTNAAEIKRSIERPDLRIPIAVEATRLQVLPGPPPDLSINVSVDKPEVNVGEYAIFIVNVTNRAAQPAFNVWVRETDAGDTGFAFETVRSYGPGGDDRIYTSSQRMIPRIDAGGSYRMSRTMRMRKAVALQFLAKIVGVNGLLESDLPSWSATTEISGVQVTSDIAPTAAADRSNVKTGDLVTFVIREFNPSPRVASHVGLSGGVGAGFQMLESELGNYGYFFDWSRPKDLQSGSTALSEWYEIGSQEVAYTFFSAYTVGAGQFTMSAQLSRLDQLDGQAANDLTQVQINSAPASARISLRQATLWPSAGVGEIVPFVTEIRNEGPDRVTGLVLLETTSANLELSYSAAVTGISGTVATSFLDSLVRLPSLEPGQNFVWQRTYSARTSESAWRRVKVAGFDQTTLGPLAESEVAVTVRPAQADLELTFLPAPTAVAVNIPALVGVRVRNLGPAVATGVKVGVTADGLNIGAFGYGPRARTDLLGWNTFQTQLLPGESATVGLYLTPTREGAVTGFVGVQHSEQIDPNPANDTLSLTLDSDPAPPIPPILRVRKVRTNFFDGTPIAEIEIDEAALYRLAPFTTFSLEGSSNLRDWEFLAYAGFLLGPGGPVTFTDHTAPGVAMRAFRLR